jgi:preprotein translocase subunit SecE
MKPLQPAINYLTAARAEIAKVTWPNRRQTLRLTIVVIIFSIAMAVILGTIDLGFSALLKKVIVK